jgi:XrtN system VIT domain protein
MLFYVARNLIITQIAHKILSAYFCIAHMERSDLCHRLNHALRVPYHIGGIFPAGDNDDRFGPFTLNYLFTVVYFVILVAKGRLKRGRKGIYPLFLFLMLFLISAYALNRVIPIFEKSVTWFSIIQIIVCVNYIGFIFFDSLSQPLKVFLSFVAGVAMVVFAYLAIYLFPIYIFGVIGFFALGISLHAFVPLLFCIYTSRLIQKQNMAEKNYWKPFIVGIAVPVVLITAYAINWSVQQNKFNTAYRKSDLHSNHQLPSWVNIAREMPNTATAEKIIETKLGLFAVNNAKDYLFINSSANALHNRVVRDSHRCTF